MTTCEQNDMEADCAMCLSTAFSLRLDCGWALDLERCVSTIHPPPDVDPNLVLSPVTGEENCWVNLGFYGSINCSAHRTCHECLSNFNCLWCDTTGGRAAINELLGEYLERRKALGDDPYDEWLLSGDVVVNQAFLDMTKVLQRVDLMNVLGWETDVELIPDGLADGYCFSGKYLHGREKVCNYDGIPGWIYDFGECPTEFYVPLKENVWGNLQPPLSSMCGVMCIPFLAAVGGLLILKSWPPRACHD
ncbi:MAG: hypothetical protein KVP17_002887 [Porospora cf. gigantea B]|uniref:uncharacterized protein n=1 Tax=Porospora cf. gigantea B TaxID=2853592 RepID=UPI003571E065|nr:MAG: hypothetical protein KVP17_002887 [Porospora cf. gigantea B]